MAEQIVKGIIAKIPEGYFKPSGKKVITTTEELNVRDYATAQVYEPNLIPENIAKDKVVLGVKGTHEGGSTGGIVPSGTIDITKNGKYNVTEYAEANVEVPIPEGYVKPTGVVTINENGEYDVSNFAIANVNTPVPSGTLEVTENGEHDVATYEKVNVNVAGGSGEGTKIIVPGSTSVPNSGFVEKVYFNTNLTPDEVDSILKNAELSYVNYMDTPAYFLMADVANTTVIVIGDFAPLAGVESGQFYVIMDMATGVFMYLSPALVDMMGAPFGGWNPELVNNNSAYDINAEAASELLNPSDGATYNVGLQNEKLSNLISASEFGDGKTIELSGEYEGISVSVAQNQILDIETFINKNKMPLKIEINTPNALKKHLNTTKSARALFYNYTGENLDGLIEYTYTSNVTNMSEMFYGCNSLTHVLDFDTANVTNMQYMFYDCSNLTSIPLFDTSKVIDMSYMFYNCSNLTTVPLLNTIYVSDMSYMFYGCRNLEAIPEFDTYGVKNMSYMFHSCSKLTSVPLLNTSETNYMSYMFYNCSNLTSVPLFNTSKAIDMSNIFGFCIKLESIPNFYTTPWLKNTSGMFCQCKAITSVPIFDTSNVTDMNNMFYGCENLTSVPLFNTSKVTNMSYMFQYCSKLEAIPEFDTSNVTNMSSTFSRCFKITSVPLFDTSNVINMFGMFSDTILTSVPLFNTSKVTNMSYMFADNNYLTTIPEFDTSKVETMISMFDDCWKLETVPNLDVSNVTDMTGMFYKCLNLKSILMYGMKVSFDISSSTKFEVSDLVTIISNCQVVTSTTTLTIGATNLAKLENVYVKETGVELYTGITCRPCVICESTDEGAMLITTYANNKGWTLA